MKKAVFIHLFYQDLWPEIKELLLKIPYEYDLYVSICKEHPQEIIKEISEFHKDSYVVPVENRGADIGGFFTLLNLSFSMNKKYDWFLKIHGKKSLLINPTAGEKWRKSAYSILVPSNFSNINTLFSDTTVGMIGPKQYLMGQSSFDKKAKKNNNEEGMTYFINKFNINDSQLLFFAGSMFWARYSIFEETFKHNQLTINEFGHGHVPDGTRAHAMERVFANIVRGKKYRLSGI